MLSLVPLRSDEQKRGAEIGVWCCRVGDLHDSLNSMAHEDWEIDFKGDLTTPPPSLVLSKAGLQFLALLPALRPNVKVIVECGTWYVLVFGILVGESRREYRWKPLTEVLGVPVRFLAVESSAYHPHFGVADSELQRVIPQTQQVISQAQFG